MDHKEEIARLRAIPNTVSEALITALIFDITAIVRKLAPKGHLDLRGIHGPDGLMFPATVNIQQNPYEEDILQTADILDLTVDGRQVVIRTEDGKTRTDRMTQAELLDLYDELLCILEEIDNDNFEYTIDENGVFSEKPRTK